MDIVERSASAHQRSEFNALDEDEHEFLEDLNIVALPFHFGSRRRISTADLNFRELIFLADWLNTNRDSK